MKSFQAILDDPIAPRDTQGRIQIYMLQLQAEGAKPVTLPSTDATTSSVAPTDTSSVPPIADASTAVDASTELDLTPPVVDTSAMSLALPQESSASAGSSEASAPSSPSSVSSAPLASSSAP
jgi:hypothetical protein